MSISRARTGRPTTNGTFTIPYHDIQGLYPEDECSDQVEPFTFSGPLVERWAGFQWAGLLPQRRRLTWPRSPRSRSCRPPAATTMLPGCRDRPRHRTRALASCCYPDFIVRQPFVSPPDQRPAEPHPDVAGQFAPGALVSFGGRMARWRSGTRPTMSRCGSMSAWRMAGVSCRWTVRLRGNLPGPDHRTKLSALTRLSAMPDYFADPDYPGAS